MAVVCIALWCFSLQFIYSFIGPVSDAGKIAASLSISSLFVEGTEYREVLLYILSKVASSWLCLLCIHSPLPCFLLRMPLHTQSMWFSQGQPLPQDPMEAKSGLTNQTTCVCSIARSCLTFGKPMDFSPPGSSAHRILQARMMGWGLPFPWTSSCLWHTTQVSPIQIPKLWDFGKDAFFFFFLSFIFISWRLITLQYCSGFCHTLTWISHGFTCVPHPDPHSRLPPYPSGSSQCTSPEQDAFFFILRALRRETWSCWQPCCHHVGKVGLRTQPIQRKAESSAGEREERKSDGVVWKHGPG